MHAQSREAVRRLAFIVGLVMVTVAACEGPSLLYQQIEQAVSDAAATADVTSPTIGSPITVGSIGSTTVLLSWGEASDDLTASELIEYRVAMATDSGSLGSVELALLADAAMDWTQAATSCAVTDLEPETLYWFSVVVRDRGGNAAAYVPLQATTLDADAPDPGSGPTFSNVTASGFGVQWTAGSDVVTQTADLEYKAVMSTDQAFIDTIDEADAVTGSDLLLDWTASTLQTSVSGLSDSTTYAIVVLVRDEPGNMALYAPHTVDTLGPEVLVTFDAQGGTTPVPSFKIANLGSEYGSLATTTLIGSSFMAWRTGPGGTGDIIQESTVVTNAADHTLHAEWGSEPWARTVTAGTGSSRHYDVAVDLSSNVYAVGDQYGTGTLTYGPGVTASGAHTTANAVIVKYDSAGNAHWARSVVSGSDQSRFESVAVDSSGNIYVAGYQYGNGTYTYASGVTATGTNSSGSNPVLVRYDSSGTAQWARTVSTGSDTSAFNAVAVDSSGNVCAAGDQRGTGTYTYGTGVSATGAHSTANAVLVMYDSNGTALWARTPTTAPDLSIFEGVAVDATGNVYVVGSQSDNSEFTYGTGVSISGAYASGSNVTLVKYNSSGTAQWARTVTAASSFSSFKDVFVDGSGNLYAAGSQYGNGTYTYGPSVSSTGQSAGNISLVKYDSSGTAQWARSLEGGGSAAFWSVSADAFGGVYTAGYQSGTGTRDFGSGVTATGTSFEDNPLIVKYNSSGTPLWARTISSGTTYSDFRGVAVYASGGIYAAGYQGSETYTYATGVSATTGTGTSNGTVVRYLPN